jgi:hypothetical protein
MNASPPLSRRGFLRTSALGGAALAAGSGLLMQGCGGHYASLLPTTAKPFVLSEKELAVLHAFVDRVLPDAPGRPTAREARIAERIDKELSFHQEKMQADMKNALFVVEHGGWAHFSPTRFTKRTPEEQDRYLERMTVGGDIERQVMSQLKLIAIFFYYCDERTWASIHYEGPMVKIPAPPEADSALVEKKELV